MIIWVYTRMINKFSVCLFFCFCLSGKNTSEKFTLHVLFIFILLESISGWADWFQQPSKLFVQFKYLSVVLSLRLFELYLLQGKQWPDDLSAVVSYESCVIMSDGSCSQGQPKYWWNKGQINHNTKLQRRPLFTGCLLCQSGMQGYEGMCVVVFDPTATVWLRYWQLPPKSPKFYFLFFFLI